MVGGLNPAEDSGAVGFAVNIVLTIVLSLVASYAIILIFQQIKSQSNLFLLIAVPLLLYAIGKQLHLSLLLIILIFGLVIAPHGLITVLLFLAIHAEAQVATFELGILLFVIIGTSLIMTWAMINDKRKMKTLLDQIDEEYMAMDEEEFGLGTENDKETLEKHPET